MSWFNFFFKPLFSDNSDAETEKTFILEPILTPSAILEPLDDGQDFDVEGQEDIVENTELTSDDDTIQDTSEDTLNSRESLPEIPDEEIEEIPFIYASEEGEAGDTEPEEAESTVSEENPALIADLEVEVEGEIGQELVETARTPENRAAIADTETRLESEITDKPVELTRSESALEEETEQPLAQLTTDTEADGDSSEELSALQITEDIVAQPKFDSGYFVVGETGDIEIDYLFDGGKYKGELSIFSLDGMDEYDPDTEEFIAEAARRSNSNSELGHIVISDRTEGALFSGELGEADQNSGEYQGVKTFNMRSGDSFAMMLVPKGSVQRVLDNPGIGGAARPLFSLATANPEDGFHMGQIADVTGEGNVFVFEDLRVDGKSDGDYNDLIFRVKGATGKAEQLDNVIDTAKEWRDSDLGQELIAYVTGDDSAVEEIDNLDLEDIPQTDTPVENNSDESESGTDLTQTDVTENEDNSTSAVEDNRETESEADLTQTDVTENEDNATSAVEDNRETESEADLTQTDVTENEDNATSAVEDNRESETQPIDLKTGEFIVGETGEVTVDFLFDGGGYKSEVAIFSLEGLEDLDPNSEEFRAEALQRITDDSDLGQIIISDRTEGAKFTGDLGEIDRNSGEYAGAKTVQMQPGEKFAVVLAPKGKIEWAVENPNRPLMFSLDSQQLADTTGEGQTFAWEDLDVEKNSDKDYNDLIFRVKGATGKAEHIDDVIDSEKVWQDTPLGQAILDYGQPETLLVSPDKFYNPTDSIFVYGQVEDPDGLDDVDTVQVFLQKDGEEPVEVTDNVELTVDPDRPHQLELNYTDEPLAPGHYQLKIVAQDSDGKVTEDTVERFTVLSVGEGEELSDRVRWAIEKATNIGSYEPQQLAGVQQWIVSVQNGQGSPELASSLGATDLGETGHIPHTYIWEFPEDLTAQEVAEKLGSEFKIEFAYPLVEYKVDFNSPVDEPLVQSGQQWHLTQSDISEDHSSVAEAWEIQDNEGKSIQGSGVVIGIVDNGFEIKDPDRNLDPDINLQDHPDLIPNYRPDLSYDFDEKDEYPSRQIAHQLNSRSPQTITPINQSGVRDFRFRSLSEGSIENLTLNFDIRHSRIDRLEVTLVSPSGTRVPIENLQHGPYSQQIPELQGENAYGEWILEVVNQQPGQQPGQHGVLRNWSLDFTTNHRHGTAVAGVAAASGSNEFGGSGVAPEAEWAGLRMGADGTSDQEIANALSTHQQEIDIYNNSWGISFFTSLPSGEYAMEDSILLGRDGKGNVQVFAGGNGADNGGNVNYNSFANSRHSIAVAAIDSEGKSPTYFNQQHNEHVVYSEPGAPILVSAYSGSSQDKYISTTDVYPEVDPNNPDPYNYRHNFGGTSAAAPFISGVVALMLEANPELTWRDVQHILVETAEKNDPEDGDWVDNGAGYHVNHKYGFGAINPEAAVEKAKTWANVAEQDSLEVYSYVGQEIPEDPTDPEDELTDSITIESNPEENINVEWVEVEFTGNHRYHGELEIVLEHTYTNAQGEEVTTSSTLAQKHENDKYLGNSAENNFYSWWFTSARHWGESSEGTWTLKVIDKEYSRSSVHREVDPSLWNVFTDWTLRLHGTNPNAVPKPKVTLSSLDTEATEDGNGAQFIVTRTGETDEALTVNYTLRGSAENGEDYQELTGTVTIPAGAETATIPVVALHDYAVEGEETVEIELQSAQGYQLNGDTTATATIANSTTTSRYGPFVYVNPDTGNQYLLSQPDTWLGAQEQAQALGGNLVSINSEAENDWLVDTFGNTTFSIGLTDSEIYGQEEGDFAWVNGDEFNYTNWKPGEPNNIIAGNEDFAVINQHVTGQWNDRVETGDHPGIIEIDPSTLEKPIVNVMVTDDEAGEDGNAGQIVITRVGDLTEELTVQYSLDGDATNGVDVAELSGEITIPAGESLVVLPVLALGDGELETDEQIIVSLVEGAYQVGTHGSGQVVIANQQPVFDFDSFAVGTESLNFLGVSAPVDNRLRLTPAEYGADAQTRNGSVWYRDKQSVANGFETTFTFQIENPAHGGGDGFAFHIQNYSDSRLGRLSQGMPNDLSIEFDTFYNVYASGNDPNDNHISVQTGGTEPNSDSLSSSLGYTTNIPNLSDGNPHKVRIRYVPGMLDIFLDDSRSPVLSVAVDLDETLELDNGKAWLGFTSGIGAAWESHDILDWTFSNSISYTEPRFYTNPETGNKYFLTAPDTWLGAQEQAQALGGNLVGINSQAENDWLYDTFGSSNRWIGLNDSPIYGNKEGNFQWLGENNSNYLNWYAGEPNNKIHSPEGEDFAQITGGNVANGQWHDRIHDAALMSGIVEIPANPGYNWTWTYFGEDLHTQGNKVRLDPTPNTDAAKADFLANLDNIETIDFENFNHGDKPTVLDFGSTQVTLSGHSVVREVTTATSGGMFPSSGDNLLQSSDDTYLTLEFDTPQSAFGFTATDSEGFPLVLTVHHEDGTTSNLDIPAKAVWPENSGSAFFYGITDIHSPFTKLTLIRQAGTERIGLDDLVIGDIKPDVLLNTATPPNQTLHLAYHEDTPLDLSNIIVTDPDGEATVKLTLSETDAGALSTATSGTVTSTYDRETGVWTAEGAVSDLNQLLADLEFKPTANSAESVTIATEIIVQSGLVLTGTIQLTGLPKNDDPTIQVEPTLQSYREDTPVALSPIHVNDEDTNETLTVTLALSDTNAGTLTSNTSNSAKTTFANGTLTVKGTAQDVNAILQDLHFNPATGYTETVTIDTSVTDGNSDPVAGATITLDGIKAPLFLTPETPYLSFEDSPFKEKSFSSFYLETFEDGQLNTPGLAISTGWLINPSNQPTAVDSVDGDDGAIDGSGLSGSSWYAFGARNFTVTFDKEILGELPTHAGFALTDISRSDTTQLGSGRVVFEAFDANGESLGTKTIDYGDNLWGGQTAEDRFLGVIYEEGISMLKISLPDENRGGEIDHIQYGVAGAENTKPTLQVEPTQEWVQQLGSTGYDALGAVATDTQGNVFIAGWVRGNIDGNEYQGGTGSPGSSGDGFLTKYDKDGNKLWTTTLGSVNDDGFNGVDTDSQGNAYVVGATLGSLDGHENLGETDAFFGKYDGEGNLIWSRQIGTSKHDNLAKLIVDKDDNIYTVGATAGIMDGTNSHHDYDALIQKWDSDGNLLWTRQITSTEASRSLATDVTLDEATGDLLLTGYAAGTLDGQTAVGHWDVMVARYDKDGNKIWERQFGTTEEDIGRAIDTDSEGNIYVSGMVTEALEGETHEGARDAFVAKLDKDGNLIWTEQFAQNGSTDPNRQGDDYAYGIGVDNNDQVYVTGHVGGPLDGKPHAGSIDAFITGLDTNGNRSWSQQFGFPGWDGLQQIEIDEDNNLFIAGSVQGAMPGQTHNGSNDPIVAKYNFNQTYQEDTPVELNNIYINDEDTGETLTVTLALSDSNAGTLTSNTSNSAETTFTNGSLTVTGTAQDVNAILQDLHFNPATGYTETVTIDTSVTDGQNNPVTGATIPLEGPVTVPLPESFRPSIPGVAAGPIGVTTP